MALASDADSPARDEIEREIIVLHQQYAGSLFGYASQIADSEETARDAVQETFLRYFLERRYGREILNARAWLYQVLRNYISDRMKSASAQREVPANDIDGHADDSRDPETLLRQSQMARTIAASLSQRELECLQLRVEGMSYEEIGRALHLRMGTVGALIARAYDKIRQQAAGDSTSTLGIASAVCRLVRGGKKCTPS
jgi:RNA polymerase sigma-70 factor (ECF subfamily)